MTIAQINDIDINYYEYGKGHPIILISGLGIDNTGWMYQIFISVLFFKHKI